jgi:hypothetical protein
MVTGADLDKLVRLARMVQDVDLGRLRAAQSGRDAASQRREALDSARRDAALAAADAADPIRRVTAEAHGLLLADLQEQAALDEARAAALLSDARTRAMASIGRSEAACELAARHLAERRRARSRRDERAAGGLG